MIGRWFRVCFFSISGLLIFFHTGAASSLDKNPSVFNPDIEIVKGVVQNGDTASSLLKTYLPLRTIYQISHQCCDIYPLTRIRRGQPYKIILRQDRLIGFEYEIDTLDRLVIEKEDQGYSVNQKPIEYDIRSEVIQKKIDYCLHDTVRKAGEKVELAWRLADIFAWDIDFIRDIQPGDAFTVLVEKKFKEGRLCGYGNIRAAFFTNKGTTYRAFLHSDEKGVPGYYDEEGNSLQKAFLKAPLEYARISSKFTKKRLHPIFKVYRPHPGVDYAAPSGTPIKTVGDGIVTRIGYHKGMGNYITIRHYNGYTTGYNHMSKFSRNMKKNKKVVQGEVIGYVGMTGYATGPHLDFRMTKNGRLVDPLNYKAPSAKPIHPEQMETFQAEIQSISQKIQTRISRQEIDTDRQST